MEYINGELKVKFGLDDTSKPKPVCGPDDLLLMLVHHWARDKSVFPTEDDRHDVATIMLFQSYTGGRPAEFVHASKGKASQDPLGEAEAIYEDEHPQEAVNNNYDDDSDAGDGPECDNTDDDLFDDDQDSLDSDDDNTAEEDTDRSVDRDSGYNSDGTDVTMTEDTDTCYTTEVGEFGEPARQDCDAAEFDEFDEFGEAKQKYKALCYEDICLWIVQNPKQGERDLLVMEVHLKHHKGVDNKPKPYVALTGFPNPG